MRDPAERGFSLVELAIVLVVMGLVFAFSIPGFRSFSSSYQLHGAAENIAGQVRLAREKAIATGVEQPVHIPSSTLYHIHYPSGVSAVWTLPRGVTFTDATVGTWLHMASNGRLNESGSRLVVVQNGRGDLDTVSVQLSGLVLTK